MTRPMGRIVAFAPETNGWDGPVGQLARKMGQLGNDVWWIHRDGNDFPINDKEIIPPIHEFLDRVRRIDKKIEKIKVDNKNFLTVFNFACLR